MSNRASRSNRGQAGGNGSVPAPHHLSFGVWQPFWSAPLGGNAQAQESFATLANRWQDFVGRRLKEDFSLVQRLARCATPDQVMAAYADFWSKAAQDYGNEIATLSKIIGGATTGMTAAAQSTPREVSAEIYRAGRAA